MLNVIRIIRKINQSNLPGSVFILTYRINQKDYVKTVMMILDALKRLGCVSTLISLIMQRVIVEFVTEKNILNNQKLNKNDTLYLTFL